MEWFRYDIPSFRNGVYRLSDRAKVVYITLLEEMYLAEGAIPNDVRRIAGLSGRSTRDASAALAELIEAGKVRVEGDLIVNTRAMTEIDTVNKSRTNGRLGGRPRKHFGEGFADHSWTLQGSKSPRRVHEESTNGPRMVENTDVGLNKNNDLKNRAVLQEKRREEEKRVGSEEAKASSATNVANGFATGPPKRNSSSIGTLPGLDLPDDPQKKHERDKAAYYRLAREVLVPRYYSEKDVGRVASRILRRKNLNINQARVAIEMIPNADDPKQYAEKIANGKDATDDDWEAKVACGDAM